MSGNCKRTPDLEILDKVHFPDGTTGKIERIMGRSVWVKTKFWSGWKELKPVLAQKE